MTDKEKIVFYLREVNDWVPEYKLRSLDTRFGFIGFQGDRRVRELVESGILERRKVGKFAEVRFKRPRIELPPAFAQRKPQTARFI